MYHILFVEEGLGKYIAHVLVFSGESGLEYSDLGIAHPLCVRGDDWSNLTLSWNCIYIKTACQILPLWRRSKISNVKTNCFCSFLGYKPNDKKQILFTMRMERTVKSNVDPHQSSYLKITYITNLKLWAELVQVEIYLINAFVPGRCLRWCNG